MAAPPPTTTFETKDGAKIAYHVYGKDLLGRVTPIALIMGMSGVMEDWSPLSETLAITRPVLVWDHRGIGHSSVPAEWDYDLSLQLMASDLLELLNGLGKEWQNTHLLGWSMGGHILQTLLTLPDAKEDGKGGLNIRGIRVPSAILAATMTKMPRGDFKPDELEAAAANAKSKEERNKLMSEAIMALQYFPEWITSSQDHASLLAHRVKVSLDTRRPQEIIGLQIGAIGAVDTRPDLYRIPQTLPTLVIHGKRDRMVAYSESEHILKGIKHATRLDTPNDQIGHFWFDFLTTNFWVDSINAHLDSAKHVQAAANSKTSAQQSKL
ncbi:Soluble epoxide hydrolase [Ceraceosorus bombacis]|uniref:Soluble epoxide hydrolase n=1 Tax=Ceraceosorus bombacis TaxID=401625 RepID=A0A0P1BFX8_9BASI|nr:Soluble epoxide hydrolase [Ceraceosorus bombacis]